MSRKVMDCCYVADGKSLVGFVLTDKENNSVKAYPIGSTFRIGNQMRSWTVVAKNGKICCEKYHNDGTTMESFEVPEYDTVLWATSSGSARRGVCHHWHPEDAFHEAVRRLFGVSAKKVTNLENVTLRDISRDGYHWPMMSKANWYTSYPYPGDEDVLRYGWTSGFTIWTDGEVDWDIVDNMPDHCKKNDKSLDLPLVVNATYVIVGVREELPMRKGTRYLIDEAWYVEGALPNHWVD